MIVWHSKSFKNSIFDSDYNITDQPIWINACGIDYLDGLSNDYIIERPNGRKDYQIIFLKSGSATHIINGEKHILTKNTLALYKPGEAQYYCYPKGQKNIAYWIHFSGNDIENLLEKYGYDFKFLKTDNDYFDFEFTVNDMLKYIDKPDYYEICPAMFKVLLIKISDSFITKETTPSDSKLMNIKAAIDHTYNEEHPISYYSEIGCFNERYFIRYFKSVFGITPRQYINKLRIDRAIHMLNDTSMSVNTIAKTVGFQDPYYFSRLFKKVTSHTPSEYRAHKNKH